MTELEKRKQVYDNLKRLKSYSEWKFFVSYMKEVRDIHKEASVSYSVKDKTEDAKRQAWLAEGILETIEEPDSVESEYESTLNKVRRFCALCGQKITSFVKQE